MPNHVTNILTACPSVIRAITRHHTDAEKAEMRREAADRDARYKARTGKDWPYAQEDAERVEARFVDFGLVIPEPESIFRGGCDMRHPHVVDGVVFEHCWNGWNRDHWGTKWNGYDTKVEPTEGDLCRLQFDTAWSHPTPVIVALSERFPDEAISVKYADEDLGYNLGEYVIQAGQIVQISEIEPGSDEAYDFAAQVKYGKTYAEVQAEWDGE